MTPRVPRVAEACLHLQTLQRSEQEHGSFSAVPSQAME